MTDLEQKIVALKMSGIGPTEISRQLGCNISTVYYHTNPKIKRRMIDRLLSLKKDNKTMALEYKGGKCAKCAYSQCKDAMVFHHRDPMEKDLRTSGTAYKWEILKAELDKTVLLCCRCHTELHAGLWTQKELDTLGLVFVPNGVNTGKLILPPSKRKR